MTTISRPLGITLLAVLHILQAVLLLLGGIALMALGAFVARGVFGMPRFMHGVVSVIGVVLLILALLYLGLAWGLWTGKGWAWTLSLILAVLGIIISLLGLLRGRLGILIVLILDAVIVYYLFRPNVRTFFGEYKPRPLPTPTQAVPTTQSPPSGGGSCSNCGAPLVANDKFCSHCGQPVP